MKKLFISVPVKGRTEENIRTSIEKMHKIAETIFNKELEVIPGYIDDNPPKNSNGAIWYLGRSIQLMSETDYFIGTHICGRQYDGCRIEFMVANDYNIPMLVIGEEEARYIMPDLFETSITDADIDESYITAN